MPDVDPDSTIQQNTELASYLEKELEAKITLSTAADYAGMLQAMTAGQVDIAYYGGVSYILAHRRADASPVVVGLKDGSDSDITVRVGGWAWRTGFTLGVTYRGTRPAHL